MNLPPRLWQEAMNLPPIGYSKMLQEMRTRAWWDGGTYARTASQGVEFIDRQTGQTSHIATEDPMAETGGNKRVPSPALQTLKADADEAAWRLAGSQFVKLTREPLIALLMRHLAPGDESMRTKLAAFLETDVGKAMLAAMLSVGLSAMPSGAGEVPQRLGRELRVRAMADAGDVVADVLMDPLRQVMGTYLRDVVPTIDVRPAALVEGQRESAPVLEESAVKEPARKPGP